MKKIKGLIILALIITFSLSTFANTPISEEKYRQIEENLLLGMNSSNTGLQISCAYFLGEMKSDRALIPLLKMLKSGVTVEERLIAALSLAKIRSEKGMFAVKQRIKFDESKRVQRLCRIFYNNYKFENIKGNVIVEPFHIVDLNMEYNGVKLEQFASK